MNSRFALVISIVALIGCKTASEKILFSSNRSGNSDIYMMNSKGKIVKQITDGKSEEWSPVWMSESGISYLSQEGEQITLVKYNQETDKKSKLEHPPNCLLDDKNVIYAKSFDKKVYSCKGDIYLIDEKTESVVNLTSEISGIANYVAWGKNKDEISFTSNHKSNNEIYLFDLKSKELKNITNSEANDERGDISPDGNFIVFSSDRFEKGNQDIIIQNLQTQETIRVTETSGTELIARWSLDQKKVYFGSNKDGNWELYSYKLKNSHIERLTDNEFFDGDPRVR